MITAVTVENQQQLEALGKIIGQNLIGGEKIALIGNLGAGKTTLAKAILAGAGILKQGFSPTFVLDAAYKVPGSGTLREIHHLDLYRLKDESELITLGLTDLFSQEDTALLVEWADKFSFLPADDYLEIFIELKGSGRHLKFVPHGSNYDKLLEKITNRRT